MIQMTTKLQWMFKKIQCSRKYEEAMLTFWMEWTNFKLGTEFEINEKKC